MRRSIYSSRTPIAIRNAADMLFEDDGQHEIFFVLLLLFASIAIGADAPRVYIASSETVDASNSRDKAKHVDFGAAIAGALMKKQVPVAVVTDQSKSTWTIKSISSQREDSTGTKIAKLAFGGGGASRSSREPFRLSIMRQLGSLRVQREKRQLSVSGRSLC